jgi:hypothetical protein
MNCTDDGGFPTRRHLDLPLLVNHPEKNENLAKFFNQKELVDFDLDITFVKY